MSFVKKPLAILLCVSLAWGCAPAHQVAQYDLLQSSQADSFSIKFRSSASAPSSISMAHLKPLGVIYGKTYVGVVAKINAGTHTAQRQYKLERQGRSYSPTMVKFSRYRNIAMDDPNEGPKTLALVLFFLIFFVLLIVVACAKGCGKSSHSANIGTNYLHLSTHHHHPTRTGSSNYGESSQGLLRDALDSDEDGYVFLIFEGIGKTDGTEILPGGCCLEVATISSNSTNNQPSRRLQGNLLFFRKNEDRSGLRKSAVDGSDSCFKWLEKHR